MAIVAIAYVSPLGGLAGHGDQQLDIAGMDWNAPRAISNHFKAPGNNWSRHYPNDLWASNPIIHPGDSW